MAPDRLFVPESVRSQVLQWGHSLQSLPTGTRTLQLLRRHFRWPTMDVTSRLLVSSTLCRFPVTPGLTSLWAWSLGCPHPKVIPLYSPSLTVFLSLFISLHFRSFPQPGKQRISWCIMCSDSMASPQTSFLIGALSSCRRFGRLSISLSSGFHPQINRQAEHTNQDLEAALRCGAAQNPVSWSAHLA